MKKIIVAFICFRYGLVPATYGIDILERVFTPSKQNNQIIDLGNNKTAVGNSVFRSSIDVLTGKVQEPLFVRITKIILRGTLIIGVTMGILIGIKYIFSQGDETEQKKLQGYLWNIIYGILIALGSLVIVEIILSITKTSVTF